MRSFCLRKPSASFLPLFCPFFSLSIRVCWAACAYALLACGQFVLCFQLARSYPLCFLSAYSLPRVRPCIEGSRALQFRRFCDSARPGRSHAWCAGFVSLSLWRHSCLFLPPFLLSIRVCCAACAYSLMACCQFVLCFQLTRGLPLCFLCCTQRAACLACTEASRWTLKFNEVQ